jgi:hypothetical protein
MACSHFTYIQPDLHVGTLESPGNAVGITAGYGLGDLDDIGVGLRAPGRSRLFASAYPAELLLGTLSLTGVSVCRDVKLTTHLQLVPMSRKRVSILHSPYVFMVQGLVKHKDNFAFLART